MFIYLDTETTGVDEKDRICQLSYKYNDNIVDELFNPQTSIEYEAMAINHITNKMVLDKPVFKDSTHWTVLNSLLSDDSNYLVAHNAEFDVAMLKKEGIIPKKVICSLKLSRYYDKDGIFTQYSLQYLRYRLGIEVAAEAHNAQGDVIVLEKVFEFFFDKLKKEFPNNTEEKLVDISNNPVFIARMPYGKYKGMLMQELPVDYLGWMTGTDLSEDLKFTVDKILYDTTNKTNVSKSSLAGKTVQNKLI